MTQNPLPKRPTTSGNQSKDGGQGKKGPQRPRPLTSSGSSGDFGTIEGPVKNFVWKFQWDYYIPIFHSESTLVRELSFAALLAKTLTADGQSKRYFRGPRQTSQDLNIDNTPERTPPVSPERRPGDTSSSPVVPSAPSQA